MIKRNDFIHLLGLIGFVLAIMAVTLICIGIGDWFSGVVYRIGFSSQGAGLTGYGVGLLLAIFSSLSIVGRLCHGKWWWTD